MKSVIVTEGYGLKAIREMDEGELDYRKYFTDELSFLVRQLAISSGSEYLDSELLRKSISIEIYEAIILEERLRSIEERLNKIGQQR